VARAHQALGNYERAFHYFAVAEKMKAMGDDDQNMIRYRRAEMSLAMGDIKQAEAYFNLVDRQVDYESYVKLFNGLEEKIADAKQAQQ